MAAMDDWDVPELYALVRRAYPYRDLSPQAFETTLEMISGRYRFASASRDPRGRRRGPAGLRPPLAVDARCPAAARQLGPRPQSPARPARQPADWPWSTAAPSPTPASTPPTPATASASASWTRSSSTSAASATCSCSAPTPGGWSGSRPTACSCRRPRARRPWCRSGAARRRRPQLRPGPGHRRIPARTGRAHSMQPGLPRLAASASASSTAPPPAICVITSRRQLLVGGLPADRSHAASSRRRAISSATGR